MHSKEKLLRDCKLYLILDTDVENYDTLFEIVKTAVRSGVDILQLRDKQGSAKDILRFSEKVLNETKHEIPFIINDRVDLAVVSGASGVHLGQEDIPVSIVRKMLGKKALIGASCQSLEQAVTAEGEGADYIGFGSVFKTLTKPERQPQDLDLLVKVIQSVNIPVFPIGGINLKNISQLIERGIKRVSVCRAICEADDIGKAIKDFKKMLETHDTRKDTR